MERVITRHQLAARATRTALRALGISPWIERDDAASALVTSAPIPQGVDGRELIAHARHHGGELTPGFGDVSGQMVRLNHTGLRATADTVLSNVVAYGKVLERLRLAVDLGAAMRAVADVYAR